MCKIFKCHSNKMWCIKWNWSRRNDWKIKKEQGHIDIIINNAGISLDSEVDAKNKETFQKILDVNLIGTFLVCKYGHKIMKKEVSLIFLQRMG